MLTFCTLFDSNYASRGVAMYESLRAQGEPFELFVFALDERTVEVLQGLGLPHVTVVPLAQLEDPRLLAAKGNRPWREYIWTLTSSTILFVLERVGRRECTYLDADLYFFASPRPLIEEMASSSVLLTEHRFTPERDLRETSGRFNVQFMTFRADEDGLRALRWWRERCLESCELNPAEGKCGDQMYLEDWPERFDRVHVLQHLGGGVAPWNVQQYAFEKRSGVLWGREIATGRRFQVIFYHFHGLRISTLGSAQLAGPGYVLSRRAVDLLYRPYLRALSEAKERMLALGVQFDPHGAFPELRETQSLRLRFGLWRRRVLRSLLSGSFRRRDYNGAYDMKDMAG